MNDELYGYLIEHANPADDPISAELAATTEERFGALSGMNIGEDQGRFLQFLVEIAGASTVVEVGTFTGMSALWLARGLPAGGKLICFEKSERYADTANEAWAAAGVADRIELRFGDAADEIARLPEEPHVDLAFIDADKGGYATYLDLLLPRLRDDGVILVDNVLWSGRVVDPTDVEGDTVAIRAFNDAAAARTDCRAVMVPVGDGLTLIRPIR